MYSASMECPHLRGTASGTEDTVGKGTRPYPQGAYIWRGGSRAHSTM